MDSLGSRLKYLREKKNLSQLRAAKIFDVSNVQLSRYESNTHKPDPELLRKFAEFYEVTTDYLLGLSNTPNPLFKNEDDPGVEFIMRAKEDMSPKAYEKFLESAKKLKELFDDGEDK